jgi:hypothetical protein
VKRVISLVSAALACTSLAGTLTVPHPGTGPTDGFHVVIEQVGPTFDRSAVANASAGLVFVLPETLPEPDQLVVGLWYVAETERRPDGSRPVHEAPSPGSAGHTSSGARRPPPSLSRRRQRDGTPTVAQSRAGLALPMARTWRGPAASCALRARCQFPNTPPRARQVWSSRHRRSPMERAPKSSLRQGVGGAAVRPARH